MTKHLNLIALTLALFTPSLMAEESTASAVIDELIDYGISTQVGPGLYQICLASSSVETGDPPCYIGTVFGSQGDTNMTFFRVGLGDSAFNSPKQIYFINIGIGNQVAPDEIACVIDDEYPDKSNDLCAETSGEVSPSDLCFSILDGADTGDAICLQTQG